MIRVTFIAILIILGFVRCVHSEEASQEVYDEPNFPQSPVEVKYASGFKIDTVDGFQVLEIKDPYSGMEQKYTLVPKGMEDPDHPYVIHTPVDDLSLFSVSFIGFLDELDALDKIKYIENSSYVYNETIIKAVEDGKIMESGMVGQIDLEKLILEAPELILLNDFTESSQDINTLLKAGIRILPVVEWQEEHPLARAEWIKVFGALLDKEELADSLFKSIEQEYLNAKELCSQSEVKTKVIFSSVYQGVWYVPGGNSYVANLLRDANGTYAWENDENVGSLPLSFEDVILKSAENDVWINPEADSFEELFARDGRYEKLTEKLTMGAYQASARINAHGGNDYWESGVVRPDLILKDYGKMLYPERFSEVSLYYFRKLN